MEKKIDKITAAAFCIGHLILVYKMDSIKWGLIDEITILFALAGYGMLLRVLIKKYK